MLVGDLVYNDDFDLNANYDVFDCTDGRTHNDCAELVFSTRRDGYRRPLSWILDMRIKYITVNPKNNVIVIEAKKEYPYVD